METAPEITPEIVPQQASPLPTTEAPAQSPSSFEDAGAFEGKTSVSGKFKMIDIVIMALWIAVPIYAITYYRTAIKKLDDQPSIDEFDNLSGDVDEVKYNLKKALGKKYETT